MDVMQVLGAHGIGAGGKVNAEKADEVTFNYTVAANSGPINYGTLVDLVNGSQVRDSVISGNGIVTPLAVLIGQTPAQTGRDNGQIRLKEISPNKWLMSFYDATAGVGKVTLVVLQEVNGVLTLGTPFVTAASSYRYAIDLLSPTQGLIMYNGGSGVIRAVEILINGTTITTGRTSDSPAQSNNQADPVALLHMGNGLFIWTSTGGTYSFGYYGTLLMTDTSFTWGSPGTFSSEQGTTQSGLYKLNSTDFALLGSWNVNGVGETFRLLIGQIDWSQNKIINTVQKDLLSAALNRMSFDLHPVDDSTLVIMSGSMYGGNGLTGHVVTVNRDSTGKATSITVVLNGQQFTGDPGYGIRIVPYTSTRLAVLCATGTGGQIKAYGFNVKSDGTLAADAPVVLGASDTSTVAAAKSGSGHIVLFGDSADSYKIKGLVHRITNVVGVAMTAAAPGQPVKVLLRGFVKGLTGLLPNRTYYADANGNLSTTASATKLGVAISATELLIKKAFWER
ncbi:hypothetical protein M655_009325 [Brevibacillus sp. NSP2.1]|uniref:hypothetical protein n=1 Tax=Brevibacillus sp. NSP2.1 TaxID=3003229 RepID=UPI00040F64AC|nr:hypothetical protein [Brevibacillus sp. NSP2.1]QHZ55827.1 hypothetical protein M655_009325 [Brevibacillus sp. NSP2.1]